MKIKKNGNRSVSIRKECTRFPVSRSALGSRFLLCGLQCETRKVVENKKKTMELGEMFFELLTVTAKVVLISI